MGGRRSDPLRWAALIALVALVVLGVLHFARPAGEGGQTPGPRRRAPADAYVGPRSFDDEAASDVLATVAASLGRALAPTDAARAALQDVRVTLELEETTGAALLDRLLHPRGLVWMADDPTTLWIGTKDERPGR